MLKLWQQRDQIDTGQNFKGYMARITANQAFDFLKTLSKEKALSEEVWKQMKRLPAYTEDQYVLKEYLYLVEAAVNTLPPQQQKIYRMSRENHLTYDEIAENLNISSHTVRNHMASALDNIRKYVTHHTATYIPPIIIFILTGTHPF
jgi:RNA polymerase sigma factor (sigma-70 family)